MRDDFNAEVKDILAKRVGMRCSNPNCRRSTSGPQTNPKGSINIGVAAHISAASIGGPRYDPKLSSEDRSSETNGIWLCQTCAKLIDNDPLRYTTELLQQWRYVSEEAALLDIEAPADSIPPTRTTDVELIRFFSECFDRPAFQDHFQQEGSMEAFDRAIEDTITAINTGCLRSRDGTVLSQAKGKSFLNNQKWRSKMDTIVDLLRAIRSRYIEAVKAGGIHVHQSGHNRDFYFIQDHEVADWMDSTRSQMLSIFAEICREAGIQAPQFPRHLPRPRAF